MRFEFEEQALADVLGVTQEYLSGRRLEMQVEEDWTAASHKILFSQAGLLKLLADLKVEIKKEAHAKPEDLTLDALQFLCAIKDPELKNAHVLQVEARTKNGAIILASVLSDKIPGFTDDGLVRVYVGKADNFIPGMKLLATHQEDDCWELCGTTPRWRGKW